MKRIIYRTLIFTFAFVFAGLQLFAQIPDEVVLSLKTGNASTLSSYFNQNIEMVVLDQDDVYSKAQAQQIVTNFFSQHKAQGFSIIHQGGKEGAKYAIGNLSTNQGTFRVYFLLKNDGEKAYIHQLRIEKQ
ncbi:DUF4783 domain-containing protein [Gaoshiqia sediminis]|uniref:DUF4783 domain-containing protein n=1 Tax=Gaoshiqia sediminis TaxID=2986998 RepID=A0AA41YAR7_9BACT|nr:DUF4783 domain-containing protein [Gaoshiqia sediminis]MCW0482633.1 DUF4783 domain-containing protein [Gaoshiqia sediminis]